MCDFEYLICTELHKKLKTKIKGKVWVKIYHDEFHVIIRKFDDEYEYTRDNLAHDVLKGLDSGIIANSVVRQYRDYIAEKYFW